MSEAGYRIERLDREDGTVVLRLGGTLRLDAARAFCVEARQLLERPSPRVEIDLSGLESVDGGAAALLHHLCEGKREKGSKVEIVGARDEVQAILTLHGRRRERSSLQEGPGRIGIFDQVGRATLEFRDVTRDQLTFVGDVVAALGQAIRSPRTVHWRDVGPLMERVGADGLPIVVLISALLGLILGFQAAVQLKQFGANIFVADLVGLSVTRELGPLMTAIIVAGRTGSAYAAELGTMKVSEEIDALRTLGFCPYRFLVFPRVIALVAMVPLLTLFADFVALGGGMVVGITGLDLTPSAYLIQSQKAIELWDVFSGVFKSLFFGLAIALISCHRGLATEGGAEGVGRSTTSSVVTILFTLIIIDACFTILFHMIEVAT